MLATAGPPPYEIIVRLAPWMRGRECDAKGRAVVSIRWGSMSS